jgi:hypothetical protein
MHSLPGTVAWRLAIAVAASAAAMAVVAPATADEEGVRIAIAKGDRDVSCGDVAVRGLDARGGCEIAYAQSAIRFTTLTMFGDQPLARCRLGFEVRAGQTGDLVLTGISTAGPPSGTAGVCGDILACRRNVQGKEPRRFMPWEGRLTTPGDRRLHLEVDVCFDTCLGRFEGRTRLAVTRTASGALRMRAEAAAIGTSGMEITGTWTLRPLFGGRIDVATG